MLYWIVIVGFIIGFALAFSIGANDVANSFGTSVGSKVLTLKGACILATIFETAGSVLVGAKVSTTISKGIIDVTMYSEAVDLLRLGYLSALIGACLWLMLATLFKLPVSGTHSIVGAVIGFAVVAKGWFGVRWWILFKIVASWFISPVFSGLVSAGLYMFVYLTILRGQDHKKQLSRGILLLPLFYSVTFAVNSFSIVFEGPEILYFHVVPWWGALIVSFGVGLIAAAVVRFIVGPRIKRHIIRTRSQAVAMSALGEDESAKKPLAMMPNDNSTMAVVKKESEVTSAEAKQGESSKSASNAVGASVGPSRRPSQSDSGKCSMGPTTTTVALPPFLENPMTSEYCGIPSGFGSSTASGINSADISGSSTPLLITPRAGKVPSLNLAAEKYMTTSACNMTTPPNSPELAPRRHQDVLSSLQSSLTNSNETLITIVSALEKKSAKFYEPEEEENEHEEPQLATIIPGSSLQATLRNRETPTPRDHVANGTSATGKGLLDGGELSRSYGDILEDENQLTITSFIGRETSRRKRTQSGRSCQSARSIASSRIEHNVSEWPDVFRLFAFLQILTACFGAFAHGGNDVSNAVGPVIGIYQLHGSDTLPDKTQPQWWILLLGGFGISVGLWTLGRRVIETVGNDLTQVTPPSGFSIEIGAATTVLLASQIGIPVSTTHCKVGSVVFVGLCRGRNQVDWNIFRNIVLAWFITVPASAAFSAGVMAALREIFYVAPDTATQDLLNATTPLLNVTSTTMSSLL